MINRMFTSVLLAAFAATMPAQANKIESVIAVDYLNVEVVMDEPLTAVELAPERMSDPGYKPDFLFNEGVMATGMPILQKSDGVHEHVYRIPVSGLDIGIIYHISYKNQKPRTFQVYEAGEMRDRYRDRYGNYF